MFSTTSSWLKRERSFIVLSGPRNILIKSQKKSSSGGGACADDVSRRFRSRSCFLAFAAPMENGMMWAASKSSGDELMQQRFLSRWAQRVRCLEERDDERFFRFLLGGGSGVLLSVLMSPSERGGSGV